jgi:mono/diheme cytochrome c family protein
VKAPLAFALVVAAAVGGFFLGRRGGGTPVAGQVLYARYCAACHGTTGRGDGPVAAVLQPKPTDLTGLRARHGGAYSMAGVMRAIDGRRAVRAHGPGAMPVWGAVFEAARQNAPHTRRVALLQVQALAEYVDSLQTVAAP